MQTSSAPPDLPLDLPRELPHVLIVIPALNEARHIKAVLDFAEGFAARADGLVVVADGGSADGTREIVRRRAAESPRVRLLENPARLQAAGVNLAAARFGAGAEWLLRLDAHSDYPADYGDVLLAEAQRTGADSVVVSMHAEGQGFLQQAVAEAQNSRLGNGGSAHRLAGGGTWVDHGHHALMRMEAFRKIGGYDESFSHNEDAELDHRLRAAGGRIWLTGRTRLTYFPRARIAALVRQYFNFGRGRSRNFAKNNTRPAARQAVVAMLAPAAALVVLAPLSAVFALPLALWLLACLAGGVMIALQTRRLRGLAAGLIAGMMHMAWSAGFWRERLAARRRAPERSPA
jgi:succinoglycan biosynthesis protein ExoA